MMTDAEIRVLIEQIETWDWTVGPVFALTNALRVLRECLPDRQAPAAPVVDARRPLNIKTTRLALPPPSHL